MSSTKEALLRSLAMMEMIPRESRGSISTTEIHRKLLDKGYSVNPRTVQRDLESLSIPFPLMCDDSVVPYRWSFMNDAPPHLAAMDPPDALALCMAEGHLRSVVPKTVMDSLQGLFDQAGRTLASHSDNGLAHWSRIVRSVPNGKALIPAQLAPCVWEQVSNALTQREVLQVHYLGRGKELPKVMRLHPTGLISRHSISYLIASVEGYSDLRQFALHRIQKAEQLKGEKAREPAGFDIETYIQQDLNTASPKKTVGLVADVAPSIAWLLSETPLSPVQSLTPLSDSDWWRLQAEVPDDQETQWWVFGLGENIRVHAPAAWVSKLQQRAEAMLALYA